MQQVTPAALADIPMLITERDRLRHIVTCVTQALGRGQRGLVGDDIAETVKALVVEREELRRHRDELVAALPRCESGCEAAKCGRPSTRIRDDWGGPVYNCDEHGKVSGHYDAPWAAIVRAIAAGKE